MHFQMLSANCFNLDQSKILSSGNGSKEKATQTCTQAKTEALASEAKLNIGWYLEFEPLFTEHVLNLGNYSSSV